MSEQSSVLEDSADRSPIRSGLIEKWAPLGSSTQPSDEALERLAAARNEASANANRFLLLASAAAFLYFLRLEGVANEIRVVDFSLKDLPFGLFVLAAISLVVGIVSLVRIGDSRGLDRQLKLACDRRFEQDSYVKYMEFPNAIALGETLSLVSGVVKAGKITAVVRGLALTALGLFTFGLLLAPAICGTHYLVSASYAQVAAYQNFRFWFIVLLLSINILVLLLVFWIRLIDED